MFTSHLVVVIPIEHLQIGVFVDYVSETTSPDEILRVPLGVDKLLQIFDYDIVEETCQNFQVKFRCTHFLSRTTQLLLRRGNTKLLGKVLKVLRSKDSANKGFDKY